MKIGFNPGSIVDASGAPLQGRVLVFVHDSLEKKDIFTMQGSEYVASENPVLLDTTGRIPTTLFFDVGVVDVLVQKYVGEPGHLADESPDEDFEDFDRFEAGFDFDPEKDAARTVETIADLKDIENPSGVVRVNCYTTPGDTFPRYYLWNPNCSASEDGGCVIADDHDASGKWCYLCEGDSIKSSVYGIKPGTDEANIGAFCQVPLSVSGDYVITYPSSLYFERGVYSLTTSSIAVTNNRTAVFSCGAKFPTATVIAYDIDVDGVCLNHDYIADFVIPQSQYENAATIRSSWCRTIGGFWSSGAKHLILDRNHLSNDVITNKIDISDAIVEGVYFASTYTFTSGAYLNFDKCHFVGAKWIFHESDFLKFSGCNFSDDMFWSINPSSVDFGAISQGHHIEVDNWKITDALNANVWLAWQATQSFTTIDLCGRVVSHIINENLNEIKNGVVTGGIRVKSTMTIRNVYGNPGLYNATVNSGTVRIIDSVVSINSGATFDSIYAQNSYVSASTIDTTTTSYTQSGGSFTGAFKCAGWDASSGTHANGNEVNLRNVVLDVGNFSWFDCLRMNNCTVNNPIHVIPYEDGGSLWLDVSFVGNTFGNNGYIAFGDSSVGNADIHGVKVKNLIVKDNVFFTNGNGVMMPFFSNNVETYIAPLQELSAIYSGNVGSCPAESIDYGPNEMQDLFVQDQGTYKRSLALRRVWNLSQYAVFEHGSGLQISADNTQSRFVTPYLYHERNVENAGDQFDVFVAVKSEDYAATAIFKAFDK